MTAATAQALWREEEKAAEALELAWTGFAGGDIASGVLAAAILRDEPSLLREERRDAFIRLLGDARIDPSALSFSGWRLLARTGGLDGDGEAVATRLEHDPLALALLREDIVNNLDAERALTAARRWLLLQGRTGEYPNLAAALVSQAAMNGGAWPFGDDERAHLARAGDFALAYMTPRRHHGRKAEYGHATTRAVAEQYEAWPYPCWTRAMAKKTTTLAAQIRMGDPDGPQTIGTPSDILIAGCGSGRHVALAALRMPGERFTVIDISHASLHEAEERCTAQGIRGVDYRALDLHDAASLGRTFDAVLCTGVLHHLPDPEAGWAALAGVLTPGGAMHVMVYSKVGRMRVRALRRFLGPLVDQTVDDNLLREVRRRVMTLPRAAIPETRDFFSMAGVHDLLLHRHEDPFDIPRIRRALDMLGLKPIRFDLSRPGFRRAYAERFPDDPLRQNMDHWAEFERQDPTMFLGMYDLWCRKPA